jgi:hypothetical protein
MQAGMSSLRPFAAKTGLDPVKIAGVETGDHQGQKKRARHC